MNEQQHTSAPVDPASEHPDMKVRRLADELSRALNEAFDGRFGAEVYPANRAHAGVRSVGFFEIRSTLLAWYRGGRAQNYLLRLARMTPEQRVRHYSERLRRAKAVTA